MPGAGNVHFRIAPDRSAPLGFATARSFAASLFSVPCPAQPTQYRSPGLPSSPLFAGLLPSALGSRHWDRKVDDPTLGLCLTLLLLLYF